MANVLYDLARQGFAEGDIDWVADDVRGVLIDAADYTLNAATHQFLSSVSAPARVATGGAMTGKTATLGVCDGDNYTVDSVTGDSVEALVLYKHTGSDATARLICYLDTGVGMPFTPSGADYIVVWDDGPNKIFKL